LIGGEIHLPDAIIDPAVVHEKTGVTAGLDNPPIAQGELLGSGAVNPFGSDQAKFLHVWVLSRSPVFHKGQRVSSQKAS